MATLDTMLTWKESTGVRMFTGRGQVINEAVEHSWTKKRMYSGRNMNSFFRSGNRIRDRIFFTAVSTFRRIDPDDETSYQRTNPGTNWEIPYSIGEAHIAFNEFELELNSSQMRPEALAQIFKDLWEQRWQEFWTGLYTDLDTEDWAVPDKTLMEVTTANAMAPYSWATYVNEYEFGLPGNKADGSGGITALNTHPGGDWTTIMQLDPVAIASNTATKGKWDCQRKGYKFVGSGNSSPNTTELLNSMSALFHQCGYESLPDKPGYSEKSNMPNFVGTQIHGLINFEDALRANQDYFRGQVSGQDPSYPGPSFMGVPIQRLSRTETAAIYPTGSSDALSTYMDSSNTPASTSTDCFGNAQTFGFAGPRYSVLDLNYLKCLWHSEYYLTEAGDKPWVTPSNRIHDRVKYLNLMNNNVCQSRMRQGHMFPIANITNAAA